MRGRYLAAVIVTCTTSLSGCWVSKSQGEQMELAARARDERLNDLESRTELNHKTLDEKIAQLEELLGRATKVLQRDSADVGAQLENLRQKFSELEGQLAELRHDFTQYQQESAEKIATLEQRVTSSGAAAIEPEQVPQDAPGHFKKAMGAFQSGNYPEARALFMAYVQKYSSDARAGEAQYWVAATYLQENKPATALGEYRKVISKYPKSSAVNVALYGMADAFYRLHACTDAKSAIDALLSRKPEAALKDRANQLKKTIKSAPKSYCTS